MVSRVVLSTRETETELISHIVRKSLGVYGRIELQPESGGGEGGRPDIIIVRTEVRT